MRGKRDEIWGMDLEEEKRVALYYMFRAWKWEHVAAFAVKEFGCDAPSRLGVYRFIDNMSKQIIVKKLKENIQILLGALQRTTTDNSPTHPITHCD